MITFAAIRRPLLAAALTLLLVLLLALTTTNIASLLEPGTLPDEIDNIFLTAIPPAAQGWILANPSWRVLRPEISIFALLVVYLGGRSKVKRFNDRTIEPIPSFIFVRSQTALRSRSAVFNYALVGIFPM
jgi:hypothetical protein